MAGGKTQRLRSLHETFALSRRLPVDCFTNLLVFAENGAVFKGFWAKNMLFDDGSQTWPNGDEFVGKWQANKRDGTGIMRFKSSGVEIECIWKNNAITNPVTYRWRDKR